VAKNGKVVVSVLNDPHREELYTAVRGRGAFLNGARIYIGTEERLQDAVVGMESPAGQESLEACLKGIVPLMPQVRTIRMLGSSAVFLPWVASGRLTAYWTPDECAWDIAGGVLMVEEAGGRATDAHGKEYTLRTRSLVASNGHVHDEILAILEQADAFVR
jgi:myo-inositol-1(or 4)-monophosphatase